MTPPRTYVKKTPFTRASTDMLRFMVRTHESERVRQNALAELQRRGEKI